jgi:methanogenic corrinoid protein MtbC1
MADQLSTALADLDEVAVLNLVQAQLDAGVDPLAILTSCREGMVLVGKRFETGEYFISDLVMAGAIFKQATALLGSRLKLDGSGTNGVVVIGTVKGDIHDIGKDLVVGLLRAANYDVRDLGVDVPPQKFVDVVKETGATVVGLSGLLTISFEAMKQTIAALRAAELPAPVKVMIGGGSVTELVRAHVGADAFGRDAPQAVVLCNQWIKD